MNDFCPLCHVDYDAMTLGQRSLHTTEGQRVIEPCDPGNACRDALAADDLNYQNLRDAALLYVAACGEGHVDVDPHLVEDLLSVLDVDAVVRQLYALVGVPT